MNSKITVRVLTEGNSENSRRLVGSVGQQDLIQSKFSAHMDGATRGEAG
ncbi:MAG: hypothetical protein MZV65_36455 [Chromatiales bacterium]|nr:hypothetical protein [Chromatiales bacterium]